MLILTRRVGEEIIIGSDIRVTVVAVQGGKVRLGIAAPDSVRVDRREVRERQAEHEEERDACVVVAAHSARRLTPR
jgi:carbon storage regulator